LAFKFVLDVVLFAAPYPMKRVEIKDAKIPTDVTIRGK